MSDPGNAGLKRAAWAHVSAADMASLCGAVLCVSAGVLLAVGAPLHLAGLVFAIGGAFDVLDGYLARRSERSEAVGASIDSICDKLGEAALLGGLLVAVDDRLAVGLLVGAYALGSVSSYVKATTGEHGLDIEWPGVRVFGRAGRVVLLSGTLLLAGAFPAQSVTLLTIGFGVLLGFNAATCLWRLGRFVVTLHGAHAEPPRSEDRSADTVVRLPTQARPAPAVDAPPAARVALPR